MAAPPPEPKVEPVVYRSTQKRAPVVKRACIFGSGAFGTALSTVLARQRHPDGTVPRVSVWHMDAEESSMINKKHENIFFLKGPELPENVVYTSDVSVALEGAEIILLVIPTQFMRSFLKKNAAKILAHLKAHPKVPLLICNKGIEVKTLMFPAQIAADVLPEIENRIAVLAGPSFAAEIAVNRFTACAVASTDIELARYVQGIMTCDDGTFRCYATTDVIGCEVASAVKNVLAIASGAAKGSGQLLNCRAAIICRGLTEMTNLVEKLGGSGLALSGLAGVGDLLLTCSSENSRNYTVGMRLGKGETLERILKTSRAVAEGVATSEALYELCEKNKLKMPICGAVYQILYKGRKVQSAFHDLTHVPMEDEIMSMSRRNQERYGALTAKL